MLHNQLGMATALVDWAMRDYPGSIRSRPQGMMGMMARRRHSIKPSSRRSTMSTGFRSHVPPCPSHVH
jgi:hypothetical protein